MNFEVIWSKFSENQLDEIFDYYTSVAGLNVASKIVQQIILSPEVLKNNPELGQIETFLENHNIQYRYLVKWNYKIIYSIDFENSHIKIADVFDTRQNPIKIKRDKK